MQDRHSPDFKSIARRVLAIYDEEIARRPLPRQCKQRTECCRFRLTGRTPMVTLAEAITSAVGWRRTGRRMPTVREREAHADGRCPFLGDDGSCLNYEHRPLGCRTHFCEAAGGMYPRRHVAGAIRRLEAMDEELGGDGPRPITVAVDDALGNLARQRRGRRSRGGRTG